ncbi:MAG: hypothetical protein HQK77_00475 [Desulfobacterales bacterium]|nr:hypothetical protein [Desulfobacterales bacterium]
MQTPASQLALTQIRDVSTLEWYVIPLLALLFYIYSIEIKKARAIGNWNAVLSGLTVFGMDFINETLNGWILCLSDQSALWTAPGKTALRTMVGWNVEIMFMFAISGLIYYHSMNDDNGKKIPSLTERWIFAIAISAFCVFVEWFLNKGGHLIWEYDFWNRSFKGVWLIFLFGYLHFYVAALWVIGMKRIQSKLITIAIIYSIAILGNIIGFGVMGWKY